MHKYALLFFPIFILSLIYLSGNHIYAMDNNDALPLSHKFNSHANLAPSTIEDPHHNNNATNLYAASGLSGMRNPFVEKESTTIAEKPLLSAYGDLQLSYQGRFLSDQAGDNQKMTPSLDLALIGQEWEHFKFFFSGDLEVDLDGKPDGEFDGSVSISDTWGFIYRLHAEIDNLGFFNRVKIGRQYIDHELSAHLDGIDLSFDLFRNRLRFFVYGGFPVRYFDDADYSDAGQMGGGAKIRLPTKTAVTAEYQFIKDKSGTYGNDFSEEKHQAALTVKQQILQNSMFKLAFATLDDDARYVKAETSFLLEDHDLEIDVSYFYQFIEIEEMPSFASPLIELLGPVKPYHRIGFSFYKNIYRNYLSFFGGAEWRMLSSQEDESEFNHSYHHEFIAISFENLFLKGLQLTFQGDIWQALGGEDETDNNNDRLITAGGFELVYEKQRKFKLRFGGVYSLYKYNYYEDLDETTHVYTVYTDAQYHFSKHLYMIGRYELDIYEINEHRFTTTVGYRF